MHTDLVAKKAFLCFFSTSLRSEDLERFNRLQLRTTLQLYNNDYSEINNILLLHFTSARYGLELKRYNGCSHVQAP